MCLKNAVNHIKQLKNIDIDNNEPKKPRKPTLKQMFFNITSKKNTKKNTKK